MVLNSFLKEHSWLIGLLYSIMQKHGIACTSTCLFQLGYVNILHFHDNVRLEAVLQESTISVIQTRTILLIVLKHLIFLMQ